jgi:RNA polymerase sigma-70 factor, ECF subfamily
VAVSRAEALREACARGRAAFPTISLEDAAFAAFLEARECDLQNARIEDLWVACGACRGDAAAIAAIESHHFPNVDAALRKMGLAPALVEDVKQGLRKLLFVGSEDTPPRIAEYRGTGDLRAWLRVTAMRAALKLLRKDTREMSADDAILEARAEVDDPELAYMKAAYRASFRAAFQEALESLHPKERTLLKQQIVDGLGIDELGALYQVHRATAARWVVMRAREAPRSHAPHVHVARAHHERRVREHHAHGEEPARRVAPPSSHHRLTARRGEMIGFGAHR